MNIQEQISKLTEKARRDNKTYMTVLPTIYGRGTTTWTVNPKQDGSVEITFIINKKK